MIDPTFEFRTPRDLRRTPTSYSRIGVIGSCLAETWAVYLNVLGPSDFVLFNNVAQLPSNPPASLDSYDFWVVQVPLRSVLPDLPAFRMPADLSECEKLWRDCCDRIDVFLDASLQWNIRSGCPHFVANYLSPQTDPLGRLTYKYDLRNFVYFIRELNRHIAEQICLYRNVFLLDVDEIAASIGRRRVQEDIIFQFNHGGVLSDSPPDLEWPRMEPMSPISSLHEVASEAHTFGVVNEVDAMYRTVKGVDRVKAVIVDFDDTLWRGIVAEGDHVDPWHRTEGWPNGFVESLLYLKRRGVLLAGVSKNTSEVILAEWDAIHAGRLEVSDFATLKINWKPKKENILEILREFNILEDSVVFVDDNPVERAEIEREFPQIRTLGREPYLLRRVLLWSPETQVAQITQESASRTSMVQQQINREGDRKSMSREEFLASLDLKVTHIVAQVSSAAEYNRAFELINKTNQFNTTGRRWSTAETEKFLAGGGRFHCFSVEDRYTRYGIVMVIIVDQNDIKQLVMSCRVIGLGVEMAALSAVLSTMQQEGYKKAIGHIFRTDRNHLSQDIFRDSGFVPSTEGDWELLIEDHGAPPAHIKMLSS